MHEILLVILMFTILNFTLTIVFLMAILSKLYRNKSDVIAHIYDLKMDNAFIKSSIDSINEKIYNETI